MAKLWIANCTLQDHIVCYRLDFDRHGNHDEADKFRAPHQEKILSGQQVPLGGDLHKAQVVSIIDQLEQYGLCKFDEVSRNKPFVVPYIYREEVMVPAEAVRRQRDINNGLHTKAGSERRKAAAVGVSKAVLEAATLIAPRETSVEFEQTQQSDLGEKRIEEGMKIPSAAATGPGNKRDKKGASRS